MGFNSAFKGLMSIFRLLVLPELFLGDDVSFEAHEDIYVYAILVIRQTFNLMYKGILAHCSIVISQTYTVNTLLTAELPDSQEFAYKILNPNIQPQHIKSRSVFVSYL